MQYIDGKYKDSSPQATVEKIRGLLEEIGISPKETWKDSGVKHCYSLSVAGEQGIPSTNGKGISPDFARASAYGELIERIQGGLCFYKFQSLTQREEANVHTFAPDARYMTAAELVAEGDWMDDLIAAYPSPFLSRESIAEQCRIYAGSDRILTVPYYSLFEKKSVYLPVGFVEQMYTSNGCCAGNTREEAWVHAFSEILERYCMIKVLTSGKAAPKISRQTLNQYPAVAEILDEIDNAGKYCVDVFDFSCGLGFPVVATRIISREEQCYRVDVGADPVPEIALQRTLTELFQGKTIQNVAQKSSGAVLTSISDCASAENIFNQLESGGGLFAADFFAEELSSPEEASPFPDHGYRSNQELLQELLQIFRKIGKPVYIRNLSYLGFPSYKFVVPGISETKFVNLSAMIPPYAIADEAAKTMRNVAAASDEDLAWMLSYHNSVQGFLGKYHWFNRLSGVPLKYQGNQLRCAVTRAYAAYRLKQYPETISYLKDAIGDSDPETAAYFSCIRQYLQYMQQGLEGEKLRIILGKFYPKAAVDALYDKLDNGQTPFEDYLIRCDYTSCESCRHRHICTYETMKQMTAAAGKKYAAFSHGQNPEEFAI